ncbi:hypothetical protein ASPVEDRAFT_128860 [Aspergillus versicolor CBS 583.65]|uniref:Shikimate dehydrogenase substrate binding N-terminal domain-containing protein n=1 Tax=Aspergillus versicolor CBS 583.65 TaxID=1036611 RepID=A0A1L9PGZ8_ASPVE|nr:uncharacterized protein ASPVEDRAFT_128860 [Aspergillus versicolor CBS 583.65]OJJ00772.1 hypothetical protein ASPVEDRAFT_128860 [Aspergillus versicolor CBS 583.65]
MTEPKDFYIFGSGISFSISPTIHNTGFTHHALPHTYTIRESASIDEVGRLIHAQSFGGASVTMPHKLQVHKFCTEVSETAKAIGAINTLIPTGHEHGNSSIIGDNTDWSGLYAIIMKYTKTSPDGEGQGKSLKAGLVIGAGGASRAALYAMFKAGVQHIYLVNRTQSIAENVRDDFRCSFNITVIPDLSESSRPESPDIIIATVPAETTSEEQFGSLFKDRSEGLCIDMSYKPRQTPLLTVAQRHSGWATVTGVEVLLAQAFDQFKLWTGLEPPREEMIEAVLAREAGVGRASLSML